MLVFLTACVQVDEVFDEGIGKLQNENYDLQKTVIKIAGAYTWAPDLSTGGNILGYRRDTIFYDAAKKRIADVEAKLNCVIDFFVDVDAHKQLFMTSAAAAYYCDILQGLSTEMTENMLMGLYEDITNYETFINYLDADKWGHPAMLQQMCWEDASLYGIAPNSWPEICHLSLSNLFIANVELGNKYGVPDVREIRENGNWNWDTFLDLIKRATIVENGITKIWGFTMDNDFLSSFMTSNGDKIIIKNENGEIISGYSQPHIKEVANFIYNLYNSEYIDCIYGFNEYIDYKSEILGYSGQMEKIFNDGLAYIKASDASNIIGPNAPVSMNFENYAILPPPAGPSLKNTNYGLFSGIYYMLSFPIYGKDIEANIITANEIFEPLEGFETKELVQEHLSRYYFLTNNESSLFMEMYNNMTWSFDLFNGEVELPGLYAKGGMGHGGRLRLFIETPYMELVNDRLYESIFLADSIIYQHQLLEAEKIFGVDLIPN